jgi:hypothetical protein
MPGVLDLPMQIGKLEEHCYGGYVSIEMFNDDL